jgi:hypothetical protein
MEAHQHRVPAPRIIDGTAGELLVAVELLRHGYTVSWPAADVGGYDLISDAGNGTLKRVQVKTCNTPDEYGTYRLYFRKYSCTKKRVKYTKADCDFIVTLILFPSGPTYYVIPVEEIKTTCGIFWPVGQHPRHPTKWKTCKLELYRDRWDQLRC